MTTTLTLYEAKTQLSKLVERAAAGEEIVIAKAGKPMARLVALGRKPLRSGLLKGKVWIADDFDDTPEEIIRAFEDSESSRPRTTTIEWPRLTRHEMSQVMRLCETVTALAAGRPIARGRPAELRQDPAVIEAYLGQ